MHREMKPQTQRDHVAEAAQRRLSAGVELLGGKSRVDVAYSAHQKAYERCKQLEVEVRSAFDQLTQAEARLKDEFGVTISTELSFPLSYALAEWRVKHLPPA